VCGCVCGWCVECVFVVFGVCVGGVVWACRLCLCGVCGVVCVEWCVYVFCVCVVCVWVCVVFMCVGL